jgi:hypothetical protein
MRICIIFNDEDMTYKFRDCMRKLIDSGSNFTEGDVLSDFRNNLYKIESIAINPYINMAEITVITNFTNCS